MVAAVGLAIGVPVLVMVAAFSGPGILHSVSRTSGAPAASTEHLFLAIAAIAAAAAVGGRIAAALGQPPVIGEICVGIMLGPSLLGRLGPGLSHVLFPASVLPELNALAELGLVLFMFQVGRDFAALRVRTMAARGLVISAASLLIPFSAGALLASRFTTGNLGPAGNRLAFVLFVGCALSVTAFPVLARILADLGLGATIAGRLSLFAAALGDGGCWVLLAAALAAVHGPVFSSGGRTLLLAMLVAGAAVGPLRWALARAAARAHERDVVAPASGNPAVWSIVIVVGVTAVCTLTAAIGVHEIIGAFLAGMACPRSYRPVNVAVDRLGEVSRTVLLPVFFARFGLTVSLGAVHWSAAVVAFALLLLLAAVGTKMIGPALCARLTGLSWPDSGALGILLNARGLTELAVLQTGWQVGLINAQLLALLTIITLVTTVMTSPVLRLVGYRPGSGAEPEDCDGARTRVGSDNATAAGMR
jgi:Kef-type K+ transport system membrane component KefB